VNIAISTREEEQKKRDEEEWRIEQATGELR
jgi:hypothetical protein